MRLRPIGGGAGRGRGRLTIAGPADGLLRAALELALDVARIGAATSPAVDAPRLVRPFLQFARRPEQALVAARRALDEDESFRARVAALADEEELGRAGFLFVVRPQGWQEEYEDLMEQARRREEAERDEAEERSARRRLGRAEEATRRAEEAAATARAEAARTAAEMTGERRERRAAQEEVARLTRRVTSLEGERDSARRRAAEASTGAERLAAEVESLRAEIRARGEEAERLRARPVQAVPAVARDADDAPPSPSRPPPASSPPPPAVPVRPAVAAAVADAASAAAALARALAEAADALRPPTPTAADDDDQALPPPPARWPAKQPRRGPAGAGPPRRRPPALPPAVFDDTPEAAAHLVRVRGALVLVDGYNAAKALWPEADPLELRERLIDALSELEARTGAGIQVVFDGADVGGPVARQVGRRVRVTFSPADVEADDIILDLVDAAPLSQPVVVASSDRRVQDGARDRGAGVISSAQLATVLGRF